MDGRRWGGRRSGGGGEDDEREPWVSDGRHPKPNRLKVSFFFSFHGARERRGLHTSYRRCERSKEEHPEARREGGERREGGDELELRLVLADEEREKNLHLLRCRT